jgi:RNA:NAD 2'-phosphotransferase (TPT1/KptA family)
MQMGRVTTEAFVMEVAAGNPQRFDVDWDEHKVRCVQGHSLAHVRTVTRVASQNVPGILYHCTKPEHIQGILSEGLRPASALRASSGEQRRQHVYLSASPQPKEHRPSVLIVWASRAAQDGVVFGRPPGLDQGVYLTEQIIHPHFIECCPRASELGGVLARAGPELAQ